MIEPFNEYLRYEPESGKLFWKKAPGKRIKVGAEAGSIGQKGYVIIGLKSKGYKAHRIAWCLVKGSWPAQEIDHINGDRADNRLANLRSVSRAKNQRNQKMPSTNTSGVVGVCRHNQSSKWRAEIYASGKQVCLGVFDEKAEAVAARKAAERKYGYHPNHGRQVT